MIENTTLTAWADIVLDIWKDRMIKHHIRMTGALWESLQNHVHYHAGGDQNKIDFFFNLYGLYVDMGVGRELPAGNTGSMLTKQGVPTRRKPKPWYSRVFYAQVKRLSEILAEKYGQEAANQIVGFMTDNQHQYIKDKRTADRGRSRRNYARRRAQPGRWTSSGGWAIEFLLENTHKQQNR